MRTVYFFKPGRSTQIAVTYACLTAFILFGYDAGVFASLVTNPRFLDIVGHPSTGFLGFIVSVYNIGCAIGSAWNFFLGHRYGRRQNILIAMVCVIIGATLQCTSFGVPQLIIGRIVTGIGIGIDTSTVPMYQAELAQREKRGRLVLTAMVFVAGGIVIAYFFDYGLTYAHGSLSWRLPLACQIIVAVSVSIIVFGLPETPRYLIDNDRIEEAEAVMCRMWNVPADNDLVRREKEEILAAKALQEAKPFRWTHLMQQDAVQTRWRLFLSILLLFMNQWTGITVLIFYAPTVLQRNVGLSRNDSIIAGGCINFGTLIGALIAASILDKVGRRKPLIIGTAIQPICLMLFAVMLSFQDTDKKVPTSRAAIAFILLYMISFAASLGTIPYLYSTEILPLHVRAQGSALAMGLNWIWTFIVVEIAPTIIERLQWKSYFIFMSFSAAFVPMLYFWYPETKNLSLEEIDYLFIKPEQALNLVAHPSAQLQTSTSQHLEEKAEPQKILAAVHLESNLDV